MVIFLHTGYSAVVADNTPDSSLSSASQSQNSHSSSSSSSTNQTWVFIRVFLNYNKYNSNMIDWLSLSFSLLLPLNYSLDNGPSLLSSITLPPSSPSPAFNDSTPGGGSLLNGPHSYTPNTEAIKVCYFILAGLHSVCQWCRTDTP